MRNMIDVSTESSVPARRDDIDGLRAVAVTAVVCYHLHREWLPGGYLGVDVFFVISGYVVTGSLLHQRSSSMLPSFFDFYARRVKRLGPALLLLVFCSSCVIPLIMSPHFRAQLTYLGTAQASLFAFANLNILHFREDYFDEHGVMHLNPFLHMWSLAVEEQFYFIFPFLVYSSEKLAHHIPIILLSLAMSALQDSTSAFYLVLPRMWELHAGFMIFLIESQAGPRYASFVAARKGCLQSFVAVLFILSFMRWPREAAFPWPFATLPVLATSLYIVLGSLQAPPTLNVILANSWCAYAGRISYPVYLYHWPLIAFCNFLEIRSPPLDICIIMTTIILASLTHKMELIIRHSHVSNFSIFATYFGTSTSVYALIALLRGPLLGMFFLDASFGRRAPYYRVVDPKHLCFVPCDCDVKSCLTRTENPGLPTLFLLGDSHATSLYMGLRKSLEDSINVVSASAGYGCGFLPSCLRRFVYPLSTPFCDEYNEEATAVLTSDLSAGDFIALEHAASRFGYSGDFVEYKKFVLRWQAFAASRNASLILFGDVQGLPLAGWRCEPTLFFGRHRMHDCDVLQSNYSAVLRNEFYKLSQASRNVLYIEYGYLFCPAGLCTPFIPGTMTLGIFDYGHLTAEGSSYVGPHIASAITATLFDREKDDRESPRKLPTSADPM